MEIVSEERNTDKDKIDVKSLPLEELKTLFGELGEKPFRGAQMYDWMHKKLASGFEEMSNLSKEFRSFCEEHFTYTVCRTVDVQTSAIDGTRKFLFALQDGNVVESVWMKYKHGNSVCISSQVGCRMGCRFCASTVHRCPRR